MTSAPQDGTPILAYVPAKKAWWVVRSRDGWKDWYSIPGDWRCEPICWTEIPNEPFTPTKPDLSQVRGVLK